MTETKKEDVDSTGVRKYWFKRYATRFRAKCDRCGYKYNLTLSHKDNNKKNNVMENFELLCSRKEYFLGFAWLYVPGCHTKHEMKTSPERAMLIWKRGVDRDIIRGTERPFGWFERIMLRIFYGKKEVQDGTSRST